MSTLDRIVRAARAARTRRERVLAAAYVAPQSDDEVMLAEIWRTVLEIEAAGLDDGFFELGGDSLMLARVGARIMASSGVDAPLATLLAHSTLRGMASAVGAARGNVAAAPLVPRGSTAMEVPATLAQTYYHRLYAPHHSRFLEVFRLDGVLDVAALQRALSEIVRRHEIFRTSFATRDGVLLQIIHETGDLVIEPLVVENEAALVEVAREEMDRVIDVERLPLVGCRLVRFGQASHALFLAVPHVVVDDWSLNLVFKEMLALYNDVASVPLPTVGYRDYALWQQSVVDSRRHLDFWMDQLTTAEALALPTDRPRQPRSRGPHRSTVVRIAPALLVAIRKESAAAGATLFMGLLAAFDVFLHEATGQETFIVRSPFANREPVETESIVGCFSHPLPFRADLRGDPTYREVIRRVRDDVVRVHAHRPVPFDCADLWDEFDAKSNRVGFNLLVTDRAKSFGGMAGITVSSLANVWRSVVRNFLDVYFFLAEKDGGIEAVVFYNVDLFDAERITALVGRFGLVIERLVAHPAEPLSGVF